MQKNHKAVAEFKELLRTTDQLLGPEGCPWDREQTLVSMRASILEEVCEVIEAIDEDDVQVFSQPTQKSIFFPFFCDRNEKIPAFKDIIGEECIQDTEMIGRKGVASCFVEVLFVNDFYFCNKPK